MSELTRSKINANYAHIGLVNAHHGMYNHPQNVHNPNVFVNDGNHFIFRSDEDEIGPLALQQGRDHREVESGEGGYAAVMHFLTLSGQRIGTLAADVTADGHNHIGVYTNDGINSDGSDSQPVKRLNFQGGEPTTSIDAYAVDEFRFGPRGSSGYGNLDFVLDAETDQHTYINFNYTGADRGAAIQYAHDWDQLRFIHSDGTADVRVGDGNGDITARNGGSYGEGKVAMGTRGAGIVTDGGHVYAVNADGEEALIV